MPEKCPECNTYCLYTRPSRPHHKPCVAAARVSCVHVHTTEHRVHLDRTFEHVQSSINRCYVQSSGFYSPVSTHAYSVSTDHSDHERHEHLYQTYYCLYRTAYTQRHTSGFTGMGRRWPTHESSSQVLCANTILNLYDLQPTRHEFWYYTISHIRLRIVLCVKHSAVGC